MKKVGDMKAGNTLNERIGREVMGLDPVSVDGDMHVFTVYREFLQAGDYFIITDEGTEKLPCYSTDIAAAWLVVERMRTFNKGDEEGLEVSVIALLDHYDCHVETNSAAYLAIAEADTAPLAICRAALLVVGYAS